MAKAVGAHAGGKVDVWPAVIVEIGDADASSVVEILVGEHVDHPVFPDLIGKVDTDLCRRLLVDKGGLAAGV